MKKYRAISLLMVLAAITILGTGLHVYGQEKAKPEVTSKEMGPFTIARMVVGTGVESHEPMGVSDTFPANTEKIYCFLEANNILKDTEVSFVWFYGKKEMLKMNFPLRMGPRWRTYAFKNLRGLKGDWKVEIRDAEGKLLKDVKFKAE